VFGNTSRDIRELRDEIHIIRKWIRFQYRDSHRERGKILAALDELTAQVAVTKGVAQSAVVAINGLADKIDELIAAGNVDPALVALAADLRADTDALAAAVAENPVP
jgi:hypothetical protein